MARGSAAWGHWKHYSITWILLHRTISGKMEFGVQCLEANQIPRLRIIYKPASWNPLRSLKGNTGMQSLGVQTSGGMKKQQPCNFHSKHYCVSCIEYMFSFTHVCILYIYIYFLYRYVFSETQAWKQLDAPFRRKNVHVDDLLQGSKYIRVYDECMHVCICICMHMYMQMCLYIYTHAYVHLDPRIHDVCTLYSQCWYMIICAWTCIYSYIM